MIRAKIEKKVEQIKKQFEINMNNRIEVVSFKNDEHSRQNQEKQLSFFSNQFLKCPILGNQAFEYLKQLKQPRGMSQRASYVFKRRVSNQITRIKRCFNDIQAKLGRVQSIVQEISNEYGNRYSEINEDTTQLKFQIQNQHICYCIRDIAKLNSETYLNDTIIANHVKMLKNAIISKEVMKQVSFMSTFLLGKLIDEESISSFVQLEKRESIQLKMRQRYEMEKIGRWTKKQDILSKKYIVFPINAFSHWSVVIAINIQLLIHDKPYNRFRERPALIYCDSLYERNQGISMAIRKYLQLQFEDKKGIKLVLNQRNLPTYQLLLPRQTNTHDCGVYMITYLQELLQNPQKHFFQLELIGNRNKSTIISRNLLLSARVRFALLIQSLIRSKSKRQIQQSICRYKQLKKQIRQTEINSQIQLQQFRKYKFLGEVGENDEEQFEAKIRFNIDSCCNAFQGEDFKQ